MRYAIFDKKVWNVWIDKGETLLLDRDGEAVEVTLSELDIIYPEREAIELLAKCSPHVEKMESFGDIDDLAEIDGNMLLPFSENFSAADTELTNFLNEIITHTDSMIKVHPKRQDHKITTLGGKQQEHEISTVIEAFNKTHPEANTLEIIWDDQHKSIYMCTQATCNADNLITIPISYEEKLKERLPVFLNRTVVEGARLLWANAVLENIDPLRIDTFDDIKDGHKYMPFVDDSRVNGETSIKVEYLDWCVEVINEFNEIIRKGKLQRLRGQGILRGPTHDALIQAKRAIQIPKKSPEVCGIKPAYES